MLKDEDAIPGIKGAGLRVFTGLNGIALIAFIEAPEAKTLYG